MAGWPAPVGTTPGCPHVFPLGPCSAQHARSPCTHRAPRAGKTVQAVGLAAALLGKTGGEEDAYLPELQASAGGPPAGAQGGAKQPQVIPTATRFIPRASPCSPCPAPARRAGRPLLLPRRRGAPCSPCCAAPQCAHSPTHPQARRPPTRPHPHARPCRCSRCSAPSRPLPSATLFKPTPAHSPPLPPAAAAASHPAAGCPRRR